MRDWSFGIVGWGGGGDGGRWGVLCCFVGGRLEGMVVVGWVGGLALAVEGGGG